MVQLAKGDDRFELEVLVDLCRGDETHQHGPAASLAQQGQATHGLDAHGQRLAGVIGDG